MSAQPAKVNLTLHPNDNSRLANLCGPFDEHLHQIEQRLSVEIHHRGNSFTVEGNSSAAESAAVVIKNLYTATDSEELSKETIHLHLQDSHVDNISDKDNEKLTDIGVHTRRGIIKPRGPNQAAYISDVLNHDLTFGIGPAGTGKTYLAVACAVAALDSEQVQRLVLVRPAVEAGERLGFLPGDLTQKIDPYLRPMYDALYEMMGFERVNKLIERTIIEVAPLAYMRGRTLNDSFVILDEAQNTTKDQMKMFLTRIGFGSKAVVTGDVTQIDLPNRGQSGLRHVMHVLKDVKRIKFNYFNSRDVVRHPLVQHIIDAYDRDDEQDKPDGK
ncbi:MAG: PhoH family protein [Gammaproteobacteria bacterium]|nr:PhoH family protein [Gammaproteobacteria bacterium]